MKKSNFALRLQPALREEVRKLARAEGVAVNQFGYGSIRDGGES